jgi:CBS domain-containing protein
MRMVPIFKALLINVINGFIWLRHWVSCHNSSLYAYVLHVYKYKLILYIHPYGLSGYRSFMYELPMSQKVREFLETNYTLLDEDSNVSEATRIMKEKGSSSVLVSSKRGAEGRAEPTGIVTERDILYKVVAENKEPFKTTLKEIMSSPIITINEDASVKDAVSLMRSKGIRRLVAKTDANAKTGTSTTATATTTISDKKSRTTAVVGVITLMSIVGNSPDQSIELANIEVPSSSVAATRKVLIVCPYCESKFENKDDLSKHIDRIHVGSGLLEGDTRRWQ